MEMVLLLCKKAGVRRNADHHDADDGLPRKKISQTEILNASGRRSAQRPLVTLGTLRYE
jgi:hypothetical protein